MTSTTTPVTIGIADKLAVTVHDLLVSDETLMSWAQGSINRSVVLKQIPNMTPPQIVVASAVEDEEVKTGGCVELTVRVGILFFWEENVRALKPEDATISSLVQYTKMILREAGNLNRAPYLTRLADRLNGFESVDFGGIEVGGNQIQRYVVLAIEYMVTTDNDRGQRGRPV